MAMTDHIPQSLFSLDYIFDLILLLDAYFTAFQFYALKQGVPIVDSVSIQKMFFHENFSYAFIAFLPYDVIVLFFLGSSNKVLIWAQRVVRIPKILLAINYSKYYRCLEDFMFQWKISYVAAQIINLLFFVCMIGHYAGCGFYILPFLTNGWGGECVNEPDALYGTACRYRNTWVQMNIMTYKLPQDGGSDWDVFLRAINWSIPTLTLEVIDDVFPINTTEVVYAFLWMFFGIVLNATIVGTIVSLVTEGDVESAEIQIVREFLLTKKITSRLSSRVISHMGFLTSEYGMSLQNESSLCEELAYSLQCATMTASKLKLLEGCAAFENISEKEKYSICFALVQIIYSDSDVIIECDERQHEMYFLLEGTVQVRTSSGAIFSVIEAGDNFGVQGLVNTEMGVLKYIAVGVCICYVLTKKEFYKQLKCFPVEVVNKIHTSLDIIIQNTFRQQDALIKNFDNRENGNGKLKFMLRVDSVIANKDNKLVTWLKDPNSTFRVIWDVCGVIFLFYLMFSIFFHLAYLHSNSASKYKPVFAFDFFIDVYWILDIVFHAKYFPIRLMNGKYECRRDVIWTSYKNGNLALDILASLPLEIFSFLTLRSEVMLIHALRLNHFLRVKHLYKRLDIVLHHLSNYGMRFVNLPCNLLYHNYGYALCMKI